MSYISFPDINWGKIEKKLTNLWYSKNFTLKLWAAFLSINLVIGKLFGIGVFHLDFNSAFLIYVFLGGFTLGVDSGGAEWVVNKIADFPMAHLTTINPKDEEDPDEGEVYMDHLTAHQDMIDDVPVDGADKLGTRAAGEGGNSETYLARKIYTEIKEQSRNVVRAVATWRGVYSPDEIEVYDQYIIANNHLLEDKVDEAREIEKKQMLHENVVFDEMWEAVANAWDKIQKMDEAPTRAEFKDMVVNNYSLADQTNWSGIPENVEHEEVEEALENKGIEVDTTPDKTNESEISNNGQNDGNNE